MYKYNIGDEPAKSYFFKYFSVMHLPYSFKDIHF